jgi:hypothetical protein
VPARDRHKDPGGREEMGRQGGVIPDIVFVSWDDSLGWLPLMFHTM